MKTRAFLWIYLALVASYAVLTFTLPTDPAVLARYQISQSQSHLLGLTITAPFVIIYLAALYGFTRFKHYAVSIRGTREGESFRHISNGLTVLVFSLPILSILSSLRSYATFRYPDLLPTVVITRNYLTLMFALVAFYAVGYGLVARGAKKLKMIEEA